jgi:ABC-2 type transport system permease protein
MKPVRLVAEREFRERGGDRSFLIGTLITLVLVMAFAIVPSLIGGGPDTATVGVVGVEARQIADRAARNAPAADARITVRVLPDRAAAERALVSDDLRAVVTAGEILVRNDPDGTAIQLLQAAAARVRAEEALRQAGVGDAGARAALDQAPVPVRATDPQAAERDSRQGIAFAGVLVLFFSILSIAVMVAFGVVEEKSSRVVEVLLAAVRPRDLLAGKVVGLGLLGLVQLVAIVVPGVIVAQLVGTLDIPLGSSPRILGALVLWFVLGYVIYAALFAAGGALVSRQEDLQSTITPISLLVQVGFGLGVFATSDPGGTLARVATFVPPVAPFVVPIRVAQNEISVAEQVGSILVAAAFGAITILIAARIYERAILRMGVRVRWREALRPGIR